MYVKSTAPMLPWQHPLCYLLAILRLQLELNSVSLLTDVFGKHFYSLQRAVWEGACDLFCLLWKVLVSAEQMEHMVAHWIHYLLFVVRF